MSKKKITAPLSYDPGKGRPKEYLAYLNWQEMQALQRLNGGNMERGPRGLPSFPPLEDTGAAQTPGTGNWTGAPGGTSYGGGLGGGIGSGSDRGSLSDSAAQTSAATSTTTPATPESTSDAEAQQAAAVSNAESAARNAALSDDARRGGINSINVGPMQTPVTIGGGQIAGAISDIARQTYTPSSAALGAVTRGPGSLGSPRNIAISSALSFSESPAGLRVPDVSSSLQRAALAGERMFSVSGATPEQQALVDTMAPSVLQASISTGLDPRTILGQALTESTTSRNATKVSKLASSANNLFGVKGTGKPNQFWSGDVVKLPTKEVINGKTVTVNEPFRKYESVAQALNDYSRLVNSRYSSAAEFENPEQQLAAIRGGGYATHPAQSYVQLGVNNISRISIPQIDSSQYAASGFTPTQQPSENVDQRSTTGFVSDPIASAAISGLTHLPSILDNFRIPSIPEGSDAQKTALATAQKILPESAYQALVNNSLAKVVENSGFNLSDQFAAGIGALKNAFSSPPSAVGTAPAEQQIANVEEQYRAPTPLKVAPGNGYFMKPDGTPFTAEDIQNLPPDVYQEYMDKVRWAHRTDEPYPLTSAQKQKVAAAGVVTRPITSNPIVSGVTSGIKLIGKGIGLLPGAAGEAGEAMAAGAEKIKNPAAAVAAYERLNPLQKAQMMANAGKSYNYGTGTSFAGRTPVQELGGKNYAESYAPTNISYTPQAPETPEEATTAETGRPYNYYLWDLGVGIPSPGDPDYNEYQAYLRDRGVSAEV